MPDPEERDLPPVRDNRSVVDVLRKAFAVVTNRLTPEVEPATIYRPYDRVSTSRNSEKPE